MSELKYAKNIITEPKPLPPELEEKMKAERAKRKSTVKSTRIMSVDDEIVEGFFYVDCNWLWSGAAEDTAEEPHAHDFAEVIGFIGSNQEDPHDLGGQITIWLDGNKEVLTRSCLIFVPAGTPHCPILFNRIDRPIFFVTMSPTGKYTRTDEGITSNIASKETGEPKYTIITETKQRFTVAASGEKAPPPPPPNPTMKSTRILHMEDDIAKGSFYVDFVWLWEGSGAAPAPEHTHEWPELIAMTGCDPEHPHDLGGEMSIVLGDETHYINKSSLVCIPKGLKHCPWRFTDIRKPTLVFSAGPQGTYSGSHKKD
jgi:mannose-6-phosphate isomerase-like protein (cupin superfamily)